MQRDDHDPGDQPETRAQRLRSKLRSGILACTAFAMLVGCAAPVAPYQRYAQATPAPGQPSVLTDATDFDCPAPPNRYRSLGPTGGTLAPGTQTVVVTGSSIQGRQQAATAAARVPPPPPPAPPPPPPPPGQLSPMQTPSPAMVLPPQPLPAQQDQRLRIVPPTVQPGQDTERYPAAQQNPLVQVAQQPVSTFAMETDTASYANARRYLRDGMLPPREAVRVEEFLNYFDYGYPVPQDRSVPFSTTVTVAPSPWSAGKQLVHIGLQGYRIARDERPPLNLVLLVDVSGSMGTPDKLPLARQALRILAGELTQRDRVSIVVYAGAAGTVLAPTPGNDTRSIVCSLESLEAGGSTAGGAGIEAAYRLARESFVPNGVNRVMLLTDGDFNVGISDPERLKNYVAERRRDGVYLSVMGFGGGNYNDTLMQALAQNGNGTAAYVDTLNEARKLFSDEISGTLFPIANDVKAQIEFNPARVAEYRLVGYETRMLAREDFNNDAVDAGEIGAGHAVTAVYEITPVGGPVATDPLRYQQEPTAQRPTGTGSGELAFLRLRYKLPGEAASRLIERPIQQRDVVDSLARAPDATRYAVAVAGFAQLLRGDRWVSSGYGYGDVASLARSVTTADRFGYRAEFINLTERAATASLALEPR